MCPSPPPAPPSPSSNGRAAEPGRRPQRCRGEREEYERSGAAATATAEAAPGGGGTGPPAATPEDLERGLRRSPKYLPCRLLYDDRGSQLYEQITRLDEYYPFRAEQQLLAAHTDAIAAQVPTGSVVVELGCGDSSKTSILLAALLRRQAGGKPGGTAQPGRVSGGPGRSSSSSTSAAVGEAVGISAAGRCIESTAGDEGGATPAFGPPLRFVGVDVSAEALRQTARSLERLVPELPKEQVELVEAEYLAGIEEVRARHPGAMLTILWLGSSVGNFSSEEAAGFLSALMSAAGERSQLLLGADLWKDEGVLRRAYDDSQGVSAQFILNGMHHALRTLGHPDAHRPGLFLYEPVVNAKLQQVEMYVQAQRRVEGVLPGVHIEAGEHVLVEVSRKFTSQSIASMAFTAGLCTGAAWSSREHSLHLLLPPVVALERCWRDTDSIFACVTDWTAQPIELRHPWLFYIAHCAAFAKAKMLPHEPSSDLDVLFSRGMDPLVQDPSQCHDHPAVPQSWPDRRQVESYVAGVRHQLAHAVRAVTAGLAHGSRASAASSRACQEDGSWVPGGSCGGSTNGGCGSREDGGGVAEVAGREDGMRRLVLILEHERMHQETLCYMAAQQRKGDAAAAAAGKPPVLLAPGSSDTGPQDAALPPFYFQQCSYVNATTSSGAGSSQQGRFAAPAAPAAPATPSKRGEGGQGRLSRAGPRPSKGRGWSVSAAAAAGDDAEFVHAPGGEVSIGVDPASAHAFLWDCELGRLGPVAVQGLQVAAAPVTVAQFRRFVFQEQGYSRPELWDQDAYRHISATGHSMPATWSLLPAGVVPPCAVHAAGSDSTHTAVAPTGNGDGAAEEAGAGGIGGGDSGHQLWVFMPEGSYPWEEVADCPVYVSLAEAQAYCRLHDARVMREAEWELAAASEAAAAGALRQLDGCGWEWTSTPFQPLPGFAPDPLYPEFSADFFDGQHYVLRGASPCTHPSLARRSFRNFYQRLYPFVFAKFRLARGGEGGE